MNIRYIINLVYIFLAIIILNLFTATNISIASIYKWTDKDGNTQFSDIPPNHTNSEEINLKQSNKTSFSNSYHNSNLIEQKNANKKENNINKQIQEYKKIKEHHFEEDIGPYIQQLDNLLEESNSHDNNINNSQYNNKYLNKIENCSIARINYNKLIEELSNTDTKKSEPKLFLNKKNKLTKLSKKEIKSNLKIAKKNIIKFCFA